MTKQGMNQFLRWSGSSIAAVLAFSNGVCAQTTEGAEEKSDVGPEIVVTASLRSERLQAVPLSITAQSGEALNAMGATDLEGFARSIPGLSSRDTGTGTQAVALRGINPSVGEAAVSYYIGDTPLPATVGNYSGTLINPKLVDVDRIEVLRGPQGTLYGAGSAGGTIRLIPKAPNLVESEGYVEARGTLTQGSHAGGNLTGVLNLPIASGIAALRTSAWYDKRDGFIHRIYPGGSQLVGNDKTFGVRSTLLVRPTESLDVSAMIYHQNQKSNGFQDITAGAANPNNRLEQINTLDIPEPNDNRFTLGSVTANLTLDPIKLTSVTSYFDGYRAFTEEGASSTQALFGGPPFFAEIQEAAKTRRFTQEGRLTTTNSIAGFDAIAGIFYNRTRISRVQNFPTGDWNATFAPGGPSSPLYAANNLVYHLDESQFYHETSVFGELTFHFTDKLKATGGMRHYDIRNGRDTVIAGFYNGNVTTNDVPRGSFKGTLYKAIASYQATPDHLLYAQFSEGFRPGFGVVPVPPVCQTDLHALGFASSPTTVNPDKVKNYEVGAKTSWLQRALTFNIAGYQMDWQGVQQARQLQCGYRLILNSLTGARSRGVEADISYRAGRGWSFGANGSYTSAKFRGAEPSLGALPGNQLADVPRWQAAANVDYETALNADWKATTHLDLQYSSGSYSDFSRLASGERDPLSYRGATTLVDARITIANQDWEGSLFVTNLLDDVERQSRQVSAIFDTPGRPRYAVNRPRTIGVSVRRYF